MTNPNVANPMINNAGAVACAEDTGDLAQCLADRLVQSKQEAVDRSKKRYKTQDEGIDFMQYQPQQSISSQPLQPALSRVMMQLTVLNGSATRPEADSSPHTASDKPTLTPLPARVVKTTDMPPDIKSAVQRVNQPRGPYEPSTVSPANSVHSPVAAVTENSAGIVTLRRGVDEAAEKIADADLGVLRVIGMQPNSPPTHAEQLKPADAALPGAQRSDVSPVAATDDVLTSVVGKTIELDLQAEQVVLRYAVNDQTSARLQVAEQAIMPSSSDVRLNTMLVGQQSLTTYDPSWTLHGIRQAKPFYLGSASGQERVNQTDGTWDERDQ